MAKTEFIQIELNDMIEYLGESEVKNILSSYSCPQNEDVQTFIRDKAIEFSRQNLSKTTLVYWQTECGTERELVGYYTIALKYISVLKSAVSKNMAKRLHNFAVTHELNEEDKKYILAAPLIAQLGKNYENGNDVLVSGSDLLQMALEKIKRIQIQIGGRFVFLECEDVQKLKDFYESKDRKSVV